MMSMVISIAIAAIGAAVAYFLPKNKTTKIASASISFLILFLIIRNVLVPYHQARTFETDTLDRFPILSTISKYYPQEYQTYATLVKKDFLHSSDKSKLREYSTQLINQVLEKSIPTASNESLYHFLKITHNVYEQLFEVDPKLVLALEFYVRMKNQYSIEDISSAISKDLLQEKLTAEEKIIESGAKSQNSLPEDEVDATIANFRKIIAGLYKKYGNEAVIDTFSNANEPFKDPQKSAKIVISLYEKVIAEGEAKSAAILKLIFLKSKQEASQ